MRDIKNINLKMNKDMSHSY